MHVKFKSYHLYKEARQKEEGKKDSGCFPNKQKQGKENKDKINAKEDKKKEMKKK